MIHKGYTIPWGAVYAANGVAEGKIAFGRATPGWKLFSCTVSLTRLWACSSAQIVITRPILTDADRHIDIMAEFGKLGMLPEKPLVIRLGYAKRPNSDDAESARVFFGYIDTIRIDGNSRYMKATISCRDPMRFLIENKFSGSIYETNAQVFAKDGVGDTAQPKGFKNGLSKGAIISWLISSGSNGGCKPGKIDEGRVLKTPQAVLDGTFQNFNLMNKFPLEVIKHIGTLEAEPKEFYADVDTGLINWTGRETVSPAPNSFFNPGSAWTYSFLVTAPDGTPPNVISTATDWSTVGAISELIVVNPLSSTKKGDGAVPGAGVLSVSGNLKKIRGVDSFVKRTRFIFDDTITPNDLEPAKALIDGMFRVWGRDIRSGTCIVPGNPWQRIGDAMVIYNFGFYNGDTMRTEALTHKLTATGSNKGFRTSIAWSEPDKSMSDNIVTQDLYRGGKTRKTINNAG